MSENIDQADTGAGEAAPAPPSMPEIHVVQGQVDTTGRWVTMLRFDYAANGPDGKALHRMTSAEIVSRLNAALVACDATAVINNEVWNLAKFLRFRPLIEG